jgi:hypothetical protein
VFNEYPYRNLSDINLDFILKKVKDCISKVETIDGYIDKHEPEYLALKKLVDDLYSGNFPPEYIKALSKWCEQNITDILADLGKHVYFGLTSSGYFCAYIPSWMDFIEFGTIQDGDLYGHLTLSYD